MNFEPLFETNIHPGIARMAQYCSDLSRKRDMPRRSEFRPSNVRSLLGYMFLIDVLPDEDDYHFSLFGIHMSVLYGLDLTDKRLSQVGDDQLQRFLRKTYDKVVATRSYQYLRGRYVWPDRSVDIERLLVPMTNDDGQLTTILGLTIPNTPTDTLLVFAGVGAAQLQIDEEIDSARP